MDVWLWMYKRVCQHAIKHIRNCRCVPHSYPVMHTKCLRTPEQREVSFYSVCVFERERLREPDS